MPELTALGFCGADDSVHPHQLALLCQAYSKIEFGVLFRPDKEGTPRYASPQWVERLAQTVHTLKHNHVHMKLAAHLCGSRVNDLLSGNAHEFMQYLIQCGFGRVQINATAVNGVDTSQLALQVPHVWNTIQSFPQLEFIVQKNAETEPLWKGLEERLQQQQQQTSKVGNVSMLVDESKGTGILSSSWPIPTCTLYQTGYAGGLGPDTISTVLPQIVQAVQHSSPPDGGRFWMDMESSLRSIKNDRDVFDLDKCHQVIDVVCELGWMQRPSFLQS